MTFRNLLLLLLVGLSACRPKHTVTPAFYYWKTVYQTDSQTTAAFRTVGARKLYLRLCDVGWNGQSIVPHDMLQLGEAVFPEAEIIPVIFLEPPALKHLDGEAETAQLAQNLTHFADAFCRQQRWAIRELQIDCDWSAKTATAYFGLLEALKKEAFLKGKTLSVTLRLHQVKYRAQSGTPPTDRCMLMAYNMGDFRKPSAQNSILDEATAKDYLQTLDKYPLPLDLALPIFRWTLWYRNGRFLGILRGVLPENLPHQPFLKTTGKPNLYTCLETRNWSGYELQKGDLLRAEAPTPADVAAVAAYAARRISNKNFTLSFYHLSPENLSHYGPAQLETILQSAR